MKKLGTTVGAIQKCCRWHKRVGIDWLPRHWPVTEGIEKNISESLVIIAEEINFFTFLL